MIDTVTQNSLFLGNKIRFRSIKAYLFICNLGGNLSNMTES